MQLNVTGHHVDVSAALREYVGTKMHRIEKHFDHVSQVHCILTVEKQGHKAEATANLRGAQVYAESVEPDMYAAIDRLADKLDRRILKHKEKRQNHHPRGHQKPGPSDPII
ncbi:MAG: ribosome-associated translation inhibitor RaiA [Pseudomonadota bacterium]